MEDGRLAYHLKRAWQDGTRQVGVSGHELIEKLVALVPSPRAHQVVYHGVLSPNARLRRQVVAPPPDDSVAPQASASAIPRRMRMDWASLLARVHALDLRACPRCRGRMMVIAAILKSCGLFDE